MTVVKLVDPARQHSICADLQARLLDYAARVDELRSPEQVLDELHLRELAQRFAV